MPGSSVRTSPRALPPESGFRPLLGGPDLLTAAAMEPDGQDPVPVNSMTLLQAAYSHPGLAEHYAGTSNGFFRQVVTNGNISGSGSATRTTASGAWGAAGRRTPRRPRAATSRAHTDLVSRRGIGAPRRQTASQGLPYSAYDAQAGSPSPCLSITACRARATAVPIGVRSWWPCP
jgi:hypothetical protein